MIKELNGFFLLDGKLLYLSKNFIGYDPFISPGLQYERKKHSGLKVSVYDFDMNGSSFVAVLSFFIAGGPLRGYKKTELFRDGHLFLQQEIGGMGHGTNYSKGKDYYITYDDAFLIKNGHNMQSRKNDQPIPESGQLDEYLFWFRNIVIPGKYDAPKDLSDIYDGELYTSFKIEPFRQKEWEARGRFSNKDIHIVRSSIPGFFIAQSDKKHGDRFRRSKNMSALRRTEFRINGEIYSFQDSI